MMTRSLFSAIAVSAFTLVTSSLTAYAWEGKPAPFQLSPAGFAKYLNTLSWEDGKRRKFSNLNGCKEILSMYACKYGYVSISDPMGSRFCELDRDADHPYDNSFDFAVVYKGWDGRTSHGGTYDWKCR